MSKPKMGMPPFKSPLNALAWKLFLILSAVSSLSNCANAIMIVIKTFPAGLVVSKSYCKQIKSAPKSSSS
nr:hypothetical protein [Halobacteriovorax sp. HLS]